MWGLGGCEESTVRKGTKLRWVERSCPETFVEPLAAGRVVVMRQLLETTKIHYYVARMGMPRAAAHGHAAYFQL